jgi:putative ATP-dependent endonuclease of OLD family
MRVRRLTIENFRGSLTGTVTFGGGHTLLVGGNNVGKSTVCEALDLVLGPERLARRPIIDEHDFFCGKYVDGAGKATEIRITAVLTDLSEEARNRFYRHLRVWDEASGDFVDADEPADNAAASVLALPVTFIGRYDKEEDDFIGNTFFDHPVEEIDEDEEVEAVLGAGRKPFTRDHKRMCGFIFLRAHRTGSRALSLQRGSLLDTILRIGAGGPAEMWEDTLARLRQFEPSIGDIAQLKGVRDELETRMSRFVKLGDGDKATSFFASDLTRQHLREVVSLFIATQPDAHLLPFQRLGTGSLNLLVFALLTFIAELKGKQSAIFAMEEPEIALAPHTQRRVTRFALTEMGQVIATSHSPYVIEQFEPDKIVILERDAGGTLTGRPALKPGLAPKSYRRQRKQFAEALLANAVLVLEGGTEVALFREAATILENSLGPGKYLHPDLDGLSFFDAGGDGSVPAYGPVFGALKKKAFAFHDTPNTPFDVPKHAQLASYTATWMSPKKKIEELLVDEISIDIQRTFLEDVKSRADYPAKAKAYATAMADDDVRKLASDVLLARKGEASGYAAILIAHCQTDADLPLTIRTTLLAIQEHLNPPPAPEPEAPCEANGNAQAEV